jgi:hypothetical protein
VPLEHALFEHEIGWYIGQRGRVCRQIDSTTAARSSAMLGPVCPWTAVPATTHINAATVLANQAHFAAAENTGPRLPVRLLPIRS